MVKFQFNQFYTNCFVRIVLCIVIGIVVFPVKNHAQDTTELIEISVSASMKEFGSAEIPALVNDETVYLSVTDLFNFLKINNHYTPDNESISGSFLNSKDPYIIDLKNHLITYQNQKFDLLPDEIIRAGDNLYLVSNFFEDVFGLTCTYYPRSLSVTLLSKGELPAIRAMRLEKLSLNFNPSDLTFNADTTFGKNFKLFHFRSADWSISSLQQVGGLSYVRAGLNLGGVVGGGDLRAVISHTTDRPFLARNQFYLWRFANNDNKLVRQFHAGKISVRSISSVFDPIIGVQITNATTYNRRAFGIYTYRGYTDPDGLVELYVNNVLIDYIRADALGFIEYEIPLSYGNTKISLLFYGPSGEEFTDEKTFHIPMTFLPKNEFEYTLSAGMIENHEGNFFSQGRINYGLSENITVGGGLEYTYSTEKIQALPFINASLRLASNMFFNWEYSPGTLYKGNLTYFSLSKLQFELQYVKYSIQQEAIKYNYNEQRKGLVSMPFLIGNRTVTSRLSFSQNILNDFSFYNVELQLSLATKWLNINLTQSALLRSGSETIYSTISSSIRLPKQIRFSQRVIYSLTDNKLMSLNLGVEKKVSRSIYVNAAYEQSFSHISHSFRLGISCNLASANVNALVSISKNSTVFVQSASGSVIYDKNLGGARFMKNSNVGSGAVCFLAFMDLNGNGKRDEEEPGVKGIKVKIHSGGGKRINTDSTSIFLGLEPYIDYNFTIDGYGLENISWRINHPLVSISIDPNQLKTIDVAIISVGEAAGKVYYLNKEGVKVAIGRVNVEIHNKKTGEVVSTATEFDGYFSYLGLLPGDYFVKVADALLDKMNLVAPAESSSFTINANIHGDIVDDLEISLTGSASE